MSACKVIATYFGHRTIRANAIFPYHRQTIKGAVAVREMLTDVLRAECSAAQIIIVNNVSGAPEETWLNDLTGNVIVESRENVGGSFGAYDHAFQKYRDRHEWWMFTEDDIVIGTAGYYEKFIEKFEASPRCGMVAAVGVCDRAPQHAHGGVGLTHRSVLDAVCEANRGVLPHPFHHGWRRRNIELDGEVRFTNIMVELGYQLVPFGNNREWNWRVNACLPYKNWIEAGKPS